MDSKIGNISKRIPLGTKEIQSIFQNMLSEKILKSPTTKQKKSSGSYCEAQILIIIIC